MTPVAAQQNPDVQELLAAFFVTAAQAWVAIGTTQICSPSTQTPSRLFQTTNGGQTWQLMTGQVGQVGQITFVNAQDGWLFSNGGAAAGSEGGDIFRTTNGGAGWTDVMSIRPETNPQAGALPFSGDKSGLSFRDASTGWATGFVAGPNLFPWLYVTHDGGATWQHQSLPIPSAITNAQVALTPPTFFNAQAGILPVDFNQQNAPGLDVYFTQDGGATWQSTALVLASANSVDFIDPARGWATDGATLLVTSDVAQHWQSLTTGGLFQQVGYLDFISPTLGWAIASQDSAHALLLQTTDGGHTWTQVSYSLS